VDVEDLDRRCRSSPVHRPPVLRDRAPFLCDAVGAESGSSQRTWKGGIVAQRVSLADLVAEVASQLRLAADRVQDAPDHVMRFQECELETAVSVDTEGGGGVKIWVIEVGGRRKRSESNTVRVRFTNLPETPLVLPVLTKAPVADGGGDGEEQ
jgi:hypothetical protein